MGRTFPFLFGGTFIEAILPLTKRLIFLVFPFLFGGTFIEAGIVFVASLAGAIISLPFRRDFH